MANVKKSIIEEALLEAEAIDATFKSNAKEILTHTMSSEIEEMVKESLTGSKKRRLKEDEEEGTDLNLDLDSDDENDEFDLDIDTEGGEGDLDLDLDLDSDDENEEIEDDELEFDAEDEGEGLDLGDDLDLGGLELGGDNADLDLGLGGEEEGDIMGDVETVDLTGASDSDVISVFKKMGPEDEIEVVNDNGTVTLKDNQSGSEYRIELNQAGEAIEMDVNPMDSLELELGEGVEDSDEVIYEIEVDDDEDDMSDYMEDDMSDYMEDEMDVDMEVEEGRIPRTLGKVAKLPNRKTSDINRNREEMGMAESRTPQITKLIKENTNLNTKNTTLETENNELKENHEKMVGALKQFRKKLQEVAVFNSNLTYAVRLFTENSTTKEEKQEILKRLDSAKDLKESQSIYKQLVKEYSSSKAPIIKESIDEKINKTASSGAQISEQSVFVHPELQNMKKLWEYDYKK